MSYRLNNENNVLAVISDKDNATAEELDMTSTSAPENITDRSTGGGDKVAVRSTKNVYWNGVGRLSKGINIISKKELEHWLQKPYCSLVDPEEVAREYGVK